MSFLATEDAHKVWLERLGFSRIFRLPCFALLEAAGHEAAKQEYRRRFAEEIFSDQRDFLGARVVGCHQSTGNPSLHLVEMSVSEDGPGSCNGHFATPWSFAIYERSPGCFVSLADLNSERPWDEWDQRLNPARKLEGLVKAEFKLLDVDGDGYVNHEELHGVLKHVDAKAWTHERVDRLLHFVDANDDGRIQYDELLSWLDSVKGTSGRSTFLTAAENWVM